MITFCFGPLTQSKKKLRLYLLCVPAAILTSALRGLALIPRLEGQQRTGIRTRDASASHLPRVALTTRAPALNSEIPIDGTINCTPTSLGNI